MSRILERFGPARVFNVLKFLALFYVRNRLKKSAGKFDLGVQKSYYPLIWISRDMMIHEKLERTGT